jgi:cellulose synthase/poly-beta-1,6-N-acetylglucosamine synthase-like glycosyltransferase
MPVLITITFLLTLAYVILMLLYRKGWAAQNDFVMSADFEPNTAISIIIPARNEANNIQRCIDSILAQDYPQEIFEIIVIDDHSTDDTFELVSAYGGNVRCIKLSEHLKDGEQLIAYKKKALSIGIEQSKGKLIVTTDADCTARPDWLRNIAAIYEQQQPVMIVAPVDFTCDGSILQLFQSIDFMSMQGITAAAQQLKLGNMSNGANLAFSKEAFYKVEGYTGIDHLASGDDYLLMMKLQKTFPGRLCYLKAKVAIVSTAPQQNWASFIQQRIRWASKSGKYNDYKLTAVLALVYLFNLLFPVLIIATFFNSLICIVLGAALFFKIASELYYLGPVASFFNKRNQLKYFALLQPLHITYIIAAGFLGFIGVYKWKGRVSR